MNRLNVQWSAKTLVNQMEKGKVNFDNAVQRSLVWDVEKKSLLIHSMIYGYAIPAMYFTRDENKVYDSLDGKQRSNAISEFLHGEFSLSADTPPVYDDDGNAEDISGMNYSKLPEWVKDRINDYSLTIYYYEDMTEAEIREFFRRLNNGKPLTAVELTRVNTPCLVVFQQLAAHDAIQNVVTAAGKKRFTDENIAMQLYHMATAENPDFSTKAFREWAKSVQTNDTVISKLQAGLDAYSEFLASLDPDENKKILRAVKTRTHFVSCAYYCYLAVRKNLSQDEINQALKDFFSGNPSTSEEYNNTVGSGSAKPHAVQIRQRIMRELAGVKPEELMEEEHEAEQEDTQVLEEQPQEEATEKEQPPQEEHQQPGVEEWSEPATDDNAPDNLGEPSDDVSAYLPEEQAEKPIGDEIRVEINAEFYSDIGEQLTL